MFQARNSFKEVLNSARAQLSPPDFQQFKLYRERILIPIPLDNLRLEPVREQTPSVSLNGSSSTSKSKSKSDRDSEHSNKSNGKEDKMEESIKDSAQSKELSQQQILTSQQTNPPPTNVQQQPITIELDKEWETFNQLINVEGQNVQTPVQTTKVLNTGTSSTVTVTEHIPITPSSEIVLNVEDITPLDVFYSPKYKAVVKRQRKKRKIESAIATEAEQVDV